MDNQEIDLDGNITEQRLLEMSNHFKEIMEEKERDIARIHREHKSKNSKINKMLEHLHEISENM